MTKYTTMRGLLFNVLSLTVLALAILPNGTVGQSTAKEYREKLEADLEEINANVLISYTAALGNAASAVDCDVYNSCKMLGINDKSPPKFSHDVEWLWPEGFDMEVEYAKALKSNPAETSRRRLSNRRLDGASSTTTSTSSTTTSSTATTTTFTTNTAASTSNVSTKSSTDTSTTSVDIGTATTTTRTAVVDDSAIVTDLEVDWDTLGSDPLRTWGTDWLRYFEENNSERFICNVDKSFIANKLNPAGKTGKEAKKSSEVGFYRFTSIQGSAAIHYPNTGYCDFVSPKASELFTKAIGGNRRIFVPTYITPKSVEFASYGNGVWDYFHSELMSKVTKYLLVLIDNLTEKDELGLAFFPRMDSEFDKWTAEEYEDLEKTWELYPSGQTGDARFLPMTEENKEKTKQYIIDYQKSYVANNGWKERYGLSGGPNEWERNRKNFYYNFVKQYIGYFDRQEALTGTKCKNSIFMHDPNNLWSSLSGLPDALRLPNEKYHPTDAMMREVLYELNKREITVSISVGGYLSQTGTGKPANGNAAYFNATPPILRAGEESPWFGLDEYINRHGADEIPNKLELTCGTGGQVFQNDFHDGWHFLPFRSLDVNGNYYQQTKTVYMETIDSLTNATSIIGCKPGYDAQGNLRGVGCLDMKTYIPDAEFKALSDYSTEWADMVGVAVDGNSCPVPKPQVRNYNTISDFSNVVQTMSGQFQPVFSICDPYLKAMSPYLLINKVYSYNDSSVFPSEFDVNAVGDFVTGSSSSGHSIYQGTSGILLKSITTALLGVIVSMYCA